MNDQAEWKRLFLEEEHVRLALAFRDTGAFETPQTVRTLADNELVLFGGAAEAARLSARPNRADKVDECLQGAVVTPLDGQSKDEYDQLLRETKELHPGLSFSGFGPQGWANRDKSLDRVVIKLGEAGVKFQAAEELEKGIQDSHGASVTLVLVYTPDVTAESLEQAVDSAGDLGPVVSLVALPLGAGDRIPLAGLTTAGTKDLMVLSALRYLLPKKVALRASWAALGWKVAQIAPLYGANELAGWTAAESLIYTGRVRAAARVEADEVLRGLDEAGCSQRPWTAQLSESTL